MAATITTFAEFLDSYRELLIARPGLIDVNVFTGDMPSPDSGLESIQFIHVEQAEAATAHGNCRREEEYTVSGVIWIERPDAGEEVIKEARDRAVAIYREMALQILETKHIGGAHITAWMKALQSASIPSSTGRICWINFEIRVKAQLTA